MKWIFRFLLTIVAAIAVGLAAIALTGLLLVTLLNSCLHQKPIPTDKAMIAHFTANEAAFCELRDSILTQHYGFNYPPDDRCDSTEYDKAMCDSITPTETQQRMDSLMKAIGCEGIDYYFFKTSMVEDSLVKLTFKYWARGTVLSGTTKKYVYCPHLSEIHKEIGRGLVVGKETEYVLDEIEYKDTTVYRHITGDWYIELVHE